MADFLTFLDQNRGGLLVLVLLAFALVILVHWISWIFAWGRFRDSPQRSRREDLSFVLSNAAVQIINDFRHLLALVIVLIFAFALGYALWAAGTNIESLRNALQAVVATLGGLVGSIIGYYFGESAAARAQGTGAAGATPEGEGPTPPVQQGGPAPAAQTAPPPPPP